MFCFFLWQENMYFLALLNGYLALLSVRTLVVDEHFADKCLQRLLFGKRSYPTVLVGTIAYVASLRFDQKKLFFCLQPRYESKFSSHNYVHFTADPLYKDINQTCEGQL